MPGRDRTGPMGLGAMTGRGAGYCAGSGAPGFMSPAGQGRFGGRGGRGWRHCFYATGLPGWARAGSGATGCPTAGMTDEARLSALKGQAAQLEKTLELLRQRIRQVEGSAKSE